MSKKEDLFDRMAKVQSDLHGLVADYDELMKGKEFFKVTIEAENCELDFEDDGIVGHVVEKIKTRLRVRIEEMRRELRLLTMDPGVYLAKREEEKVDKKKKAKVGKDGKGN